MPKGIQPTDPETDISYRIIQDPYRKRISVESYHYGKFRDIVYDSNLFDFRLLTKQEEQAWQRELLPERESIQPSIVRSMEERILFLEEASFKGNLCRECKIYSPHGILVAIQKIYYTSLQDPFDGVILKDCLNHTVLIKKYSKDPTTQEFRELLHEQWDHRP